MATEGKRPIQSSDKELWRACAGRTVIPTKPNSHVCYFPQGHAENANCSGEAALTLGLPAIVPCRVLAASLEADKDTDEVFERIRLVPLAAGDPAEEAPGGEASSGMMEAASYAKILTQSDANNGGGFSVPRHCADTIFPPLDFTVEPPVQDLVARDVHGEVWKFRHIYRGTPRRHLLTSGWSTFVNRKRLVAKDAILFVRGSGGGVGVGVRRTRRSGAVRAEEFAEAVKGLASGEAFEVRYFPRLGSAEFCVRESAVRAAVGRMWGVGARVRIGVEDEVASRVKACSGVVEAVRAFDPAHWPNSPWRILKVGWDDSADTHQNLQHVSPWTIEAVEGAFEFTNTPFPHLQPPRKRLRIPQFPQFCGPQNAPPIHDFFTNNTPATPSIQGARHYLSDISIPEFALPSQHLLLPPTNNPTVPDAPPTGRARLADLEDLSPISDKSETMKLFGAQIESPSSYSSDLINPSAEREKSVSNGPVIPVEATKPLLCRVFVDSKDVGVDINLSSIKSYEELYNTLSVAFNKEPSVLTNTITYNNADGQRKLTKDFPFSDFVKSAKRLTIQSPPDPAVNDDAVASIGGGNSPNDDPSQ